MMLLIQNPQHLPYQQNRRWSQYLMFQMLDFLEAPVQVNVEVDPRALYLKISPIIPHRKRIGKILIKINHKTNQILRNNLVEGDLAALIQMANLVIVEVVAMQEVVEIVVGFSQAFPVTRNKWRMLSNTW